MIRKVCTLFILCCIPFSTFSQDKLKGLEWEDDYYNNLPLKLSYFNTGDSPSSYSLKTQSPRAATQSSSNTSVAWATVWYGRTMLDAIRNGWKDNTLITSQAFSPAFNYRLSNPEPGCLKAVRLSSVLESLNRDGAISFANFSEFCAIDISDDLKNLALLNKLPGFVRLFYTSDTKEKKISTIKEAISQGHPVVLGLIFPPSFEMAGEFWQPRGEPDRTQNGHAITVVGYNDSKFGGAVEVVNSWGSTWGQKGFSWILYNDLETYAQYGYELLDISRENRPLHVSLETTSDQGSDMPARFNGKGLYQLKYSYPTGTKFNFNLNLNQPAFFYLFGFDNAWNVVKLYPAEEGIAAWMPKDFLEITIPGAQKNLELFDPAGRNYFCMIVSGSQIDIDSYLAKIKQGKENFFRQTYADDNEIEWSKDKVAFQMPFKRETVSAVLIELDQVPK